MKIRSNKHEIRNKFEVISTKFETFLFSDFLFRFCLGFSISNFRFAPERRPSNG